MSRQCFAIVTVETRGGRQIAVIEDGRTGKHTRVYRRGSRWLYFSNDTVVRDRRLKLAAQKALGVAA